MKFATASRLGLRKKIGRQPDKPSRSFARPSESVQQKEKIKMVRITDRRQAAARAAREGKLKLTEEEKTRWEPFLHQTFQAIGPDVMPMLSNGRGRKAEIIEVTLDANRMQMFSDITPEEEGVLCGLWIKPDRATLKWLRKVLNY